MPAVPGTKVWIRNGELQDAIDRMERSNPMERIGIANYLTEVTLTRSRQARSNYSKIYRFIIREWFAQAHEKIQVIERTANAR